MGCLRLRVGTACEGKRVEGSLWGRQIGTESAEDLNVGAAVCRRMRCLCLLRLKLKLNYATRISSNRAVSVVAPTPITRPIGTFALFHRRHSLGVIHMSGKHRDHKRLLIQMQQVGDWNADEARRRNTLRRRERGRGRAWSPLHSAGVYPRSHQREFDLSLTKATSKMCKAWQMADKLGLLCIRVRHGPER